VARPRWECLPFPFFGPSPPNVGRTKTEFRILTFAAEFTALSFSGKVSPPLFFSFFPLLSVQSAPSNRNAGALQESTQISPSEEEYWPCVSPFFLSSLVSSKSLVGFFGEGMGLCLKIGGRRVP